MICNGSIFSRLALREAELAERDESGAKLFPRPSPSAQGPLSPLFFAGGASLSPSALCTFGPEDFFGFFPGILAFFSPDLLRPNRDQKDTALLGRTRGCALYHGRTHGSAPTKKFPLGGDLI
jgi:hypothetical protein